MRLPVVLLLVAACRDVDAPAGTATVETAPGLTVASHHPDGTLIDRQTTDAVGRAVVGIDPDSLVSVIIGDRLITAPGAELVTIVVPRESPLLVVGVLELAAPPLAGATRYDVDVGCVTLPVAQFPDSIDITACSQGSDRTLDVLVRAYQVDTLVGYHAARVPLVSGTALVDVPSWQVPALLPIDGAVTYYADGNTYDAPVPTSYVGLEVERTRIIATRGSRTIERYVTGAATAAMFDDAEFLPPVTAPVQDGTQYTWEAAAIGDAVNLHIEGETRIWDAVLPPATATIGVPALGELGAGPVTLRYLDSSELADFAALQAAGVRAITIVPVPVTGDIRTSFAP